MGLAVAAVGAVIGLLALVGIVAPFRTLEWMHSIGMPARYHLAIALLLGLGILLLVAAPDCRTPKIARLLGGVALASGLSLGVMGAPRYDRLVDWWLDRAALVASLGFAAAAVLGCFLVYTGW
ncbi:MAG: hypothetical protein OES32_17610 [Acidobacteriota bacterium]|nr:hypothetical protein [Acidobacteriota bacterium]